MTDLIERLLAVEGGDEGTHWYRNPDGPEAAARIAELEAEVARLRSGWASAQTENASLRALVRSAYGEGFAQGMKEVGSGGRPWQDSTSFRRLGALNYALAAPDTGGADGE